MYLIGLEISFIIEGVYSLKEKRSVVKSMVERTISREKISSSEIGYLDQINRSTVGFGLVTNNYQKGRDRLMRLMDNLEDQYPITITDYTWYEGVPQ